MKEAIMTCRRSLLILSIFLSFSVPLAHSGKVLRVKEKTARIKLMLAGKFCGEYLGDVEKVLKNVVGVKSVDLKSMKGHALVEINPAEVNALRLVEAVKSVQGEGWYCMARLMRETGKLYRL